MNALLNTEFRHQYIEGRIQDADDPSLPNDRTVLLGQVRNEHAEVQMGRLLLRKSGAFFLAVGGEILANILIRMGLWHTCCTAEQPLQQRHGPKQTWPLRNGTQSTYNEADSTSLTFATGLEDRVKLTVNQHVGIATNRRGEMCVERD